MPNWFQRRPHKAADAIPSGGGAAVARPASPSATLQRDRALLHAWRDGDRDAGLELLDHYAALERMVAFRLGVRSPQALLELHQELVLRVLDQLPGLAERIETSFAGWLAWQVRDLARRRQRGVRTVALDTAGHEPATADPTWRVAASESISRCAQKLPQRERAVFELRYLEGMSLQEVADRLSSNANAVAQNVFRLVRRMRICLGLDGWELGEGGT